MPLGVTQRALLRQRQPVGVDDSAVAHYKYNDSASTGTANDEFGNFDKSISDATYTTDAHEGSHALDFDGSGDTARSGSTLDVYDDGAVTGYTVEGWFKSNVATESDRTVIEGNYVGSDDHALLIVENNQIRGYLQESSNNVKLVGNTIQTSYTHIAYVLDSTDHFLYEDGSLVDSGSHGRNISNIGAGEFINGTRFNNNPGSSADDYLNGIVDNFVHYNEPLSQSYIQGRASL